MFKNFVSAIALLAIGACAQQFQDHEKPYASGELESWDYFKYGRFVASIKGSMAKGTGSAFYLYNIEDFYWHGDQDVFDNWNAMTIIPSLDQSAEAGAPSALYTKLSEKYLGEEQTEWQTDPDFTLDDEYHKFEIEWTPQHIVYRVDDREIRRKEGVEGLDQPQHLVLSIAALNDLAGGAGWDDSQLPYHTDIDYVEVYDYDQQADSFQLRFRDDFDFLDYNHWIQSYYKSWDEVNSVFKQENAYVEDGRLRLKLSKNHTDDDHHDDDHHDDDHHDDDKHDDYHYDDFHYLPPPKDGSLDASIERAARVGVSMVRQYLDAWSWKNAHNNHGY